MPLPDSYALSGEPPKQGYINVRCEYAISVDLDKAAIESTLSAVRALHDQMLKQGWYNRDMNINVLAKMSEGLE